MRRTAGSGHGNHQTLNDPPTSHRCLNSATTPSSNILTVQPVRPGADLLVGSDSGVGHA